MPLLQSVDFPQMLGYSWLSVHLCFENLFLPVSEGWFQSQKLVSDHHCEGVPPMVCDRSWSSSYFLVCHWIPQGMSFTLRPKYIHSLLWLVGKLPCCQLLTWAMVGGGGVVGGSWAEVGQPGCSKCSFSIAQSHDFPGPPAALGTPKSCCLWAGSIPGANPHPLPPCTVMLSSCVLGYGLLCQSKPVYLPSSWNSTKFLFTEDFLSWFIQLLQ